MGAGVTAETALFRKRFAATWVTSLAFVHNLIAAEGVETGGPAALGVVVGIGVALVADFAFVKDTVAAGWCLASGSTSPRDRVRVVFRVVTGFTTVDEAISASVGTFTQARWRFPTHETIFRFAGSATAVTVRGVPVVAALRHGSCPVTTGRNTVPAVFVPSKALRADALRRQARGTIDACLVEATHIGRRALIDIRADETRAREALVALAVVTAWCVVASRVDGTIVGVCARTLIDVRTDVAIALIARDAGAVMRARRVFARRLKRAERHSGIIAFIDILTGCVVEEVAYVAFTGVVRRSEL